MIIEKNVPMPATRQGRRTRYPFGKMEIGDSILVESVPRKAIQSAASYFGRRRKWQFITKKEGDGARVWRIA